jgi:phospholipid transport system substrate-binding protein
MSRRAHPLLVLGFVAGMLAGGAKGVAAADPALFIRDLGDRAIEVLGTTMAVRQERFRQLFEQDFDIARCAKLALGRYWRIATPEQRQEFVKLYEDYIIVGYSYRLASLSGEVFKVLGSRTTPEGFAVRSEVRGAHDATAVTVDWLLVPSGDSFRVTDVVVEGISMAITQRSEFASVIARNGGQLDRLFALMQAKNAGNLASR